MAAPVAPKPKKTTPKKTTAKKTTKKTTKTSTKASSKSSSSSSSIKKTNDKPAVKALKSLLEGGFKKALDVRLDNIDRAWRILDTDIMRGYGERVVQLAGSRTDNEKAEADQSFANLANRARENQDILAQAAEQGIGETDTLKSQLMALQNWDANQGEINRSFFDTMRSVNAAITDLNADTRSARINASTQMIGDREQARATYRNQMSETAAQLGNLVANPYSDAYKKNAKYYEQMAKEASTVDKTWPVDKRITEWQGALQPAEASLNNTKSADADVVKPKKKPEGATLRAWS